MIAISIEYNRFEVKVNQRTNNLYGNMLNNFQDIFMEIDCQ